MIYILCSDIDLQKLYLDVLSEFNVAPYQDNDDADIVIIDGVDKISNPTVKKIVIGSGKFKKPISIDLLKNEIKSLQNKFTGHRFSLNGRILSDKKEGKEYLLTEKEAELLIYLFKHPTGIKEDVKRDVFNYTPDANTHTVETTIYNLRNKITEDIIKTTSDGYLFIP